MSNIFPIKCHECGNLLGDKYQEYVERAREKQINRTKSYLYDLFNSDGDFSVGDILDDLDIRNLCCRTLMITNLTLDDMDYLIK